MSDAQTTAKLEEALQRAYPLPEYATFFEVGDATGGRHSRWADAVSMACWPSRGLAIIGFEIKASRSDWLREKKDLTKSAPVQQYCDSWLLVTAPGVVNDPSEIPENWGHLELSGNRLLTKKQAKKLEPKPLTREFVASLLRRAGQATEAFVNAKVQTATAEALAQVDGRVDREVERRSRKATEVLKTVEKFKEVTGVDLACWSATDADKHFKLFHDLLKVQRFEHLARLADSYRRVADEVSGLEKALAECGFAIGEQA